MAKKRKKKSQHTEGKAKKIFEMIIIYILFSTAKARKKREEMRRKKNAPFCCCHVKWGRKQKNIYIYVYIRVVIGGEWVAKKQKINKKKNCSVTQVDFFRCRRRRRCCVFFFFIIYNWKSHPCLLYYPCYGMILWSVYKHWVILW